MIETSLPTLIGRAVRTCLLANVDLVSMVPTITLHNPESQDSFLAAGRIMIWTLPGSSTINPQVGNAIERTVKVAVGLVLPSNDQPVSDDVLAPEDLLEHIQKVLAIGQVPSDPGKLINEQAAPDAPPRDLYLNRIQPTFSTPSKQRVGRTALTLWPLVVTYECRQTRIGRTPLP